MKMKIKLLLMFLLVVVACSKEDDNFQYALNDQKFISRIIPDGGGYWLITKTDQNVNAKVWSGNDFMDGLTYHTEEKSTSIPAFTIFLDAEKVDSTLLTLTSFGVFSFQHNMQKSTIKEAHANEEFKLMTKNTDGKIWILSNQSIQSLDGKIIAFPNNISAIDFESAKDNCFWIASSDTVYHLKSSKLTKQSLKEISETKNSTSSIFNLKVDPGNNVWLNTSEMLYRLNGDDWKDVKPGNFVRDNFKTIPFMDVDAKGKLWLAEKNYQAFTTLHCFNGSVWSSYKLNPPLESWINDVETAEPGKVWIATVLGLQKLDIN